MYLKLNNLRNWSKPLAIAKIKKIRTKFKVALIIADSHLKQLFIFLYGE